MPDKSKRLTALIGCILAIGTFAIFWRVLGCDFVAFDDNLYVTQNTHVHPGLSWAGVKWAFQATRASNWHPLTWLSHALDCQVYGLRPGMHHLTNLLLHTANTLLLFVWLRRLTDAPWRSAFVAALFAWHPLHVESVAWVSERKDVLSTFFWMLTLLAYARYVDESKIKSQRSKIFYALAVLSFALGLLSKPMVVTLPFVLLLIDFWGAESQAPIPISKLPWKKLIFEKVPFFALAASSCIVTFLAQSKGGAVLSFDRLPLDGRAANSAVAYFRYLRKTFWPDDLAVYYPFPLTGWQDLQVAGAALFLLLISWVAIKFLRRRPWFATGWFWFLGTLVPMIGIVQVGGQSMADRYSYVPLIGIFIIVAWGIAEFAEWSKRRNETVTVAVLALLGCATMTWLQVGYWKDSETLFKHTLKVTGDNYVICSNLGGYLDEQNKPNEALLYFREALRLNPSYPVAWVNLGDTLVEQGNVAEGTAALLKALELNPEQVEGHLNLGKALNKQGKTTDAIAQFREAARLRPPWSLPHKFLASTLAAQGDLPAAITEYQTAAELDPNDPEVETQLGALLSQKGKSADAIEHYREAVRRYHMIMKLTPDSPAILNNLAWLLATNPNAEVRNGPEAVALAGRACELAQWKRAILVGTLAAAQAEAGQFDDAIKSAHKARETALASNEPDIAARNEELLKLYESHQPYREKY